MRQIALLLAALLLVACAPQPLSPAERVVAEPTALSMPPAPTEAATEPAAPAPSTVEPAVFKGEQLSGTAESKYYSFNKDDYDWALKNKRIIMLYFYANWCPVCTEQEPFMRAAFNELHDADVIGFRVNYRDSETDNAEVELARQFGVSYQHTKVILVSGQRVLKDTRNWNKQRYLDEMRKVK
ncbi:thioredoxin family protein [Candidatus Woesearchaeota archaeon]|nr:thioredoxin family protein [Candidatus Woesearchaeota archaeon]